MQPHACISDFVRIFIGLSQNQFPTSTLTIPTDALKSLTWGPAKMSPLWYTNVYFYTQTMNLTVWLYWYKLFIPAWEFTLASLVKRAINLSFLFAHSLLIRSSRAARWKTCVNTHALFSFFYETVRCTIIAELSTRSNCNAICRQSIPSQALKTCSVWWVFLPVLHSVSTFTLPVQMHWHC